MNNGLLAVAPPAEAATSVKVAIMSSQKIANICEMCNMRLFHSTGKVREKPPKRFTRDAGQ